MRAVNAREARHAIAPQRVNACQRLEYLSFRVSFGVWGVIIQGLVLFEKDWVFVFKGSGYFLSRVLGIYYSGVNKDRVTIRLITGGVGAGHAPGQANF